MHAYVLDILSLFDKRSIIGFIMTDKMAEIARGAKTRIYLFKKLPKIFIEKTMNASTMQTDMQVIA